VAIFRHPRNPPTSIHITCEYLRCYRQGGQYEPAAQFLTSNMLARIGSYSNDIDLLTVITEEGQSYTVQYDPDSGSYAETTRERVRRPLVLSFT